jgi:hypothetical protein
MARAPVSKTGGWGFESLHSCQARTTEDGRRKNELSWAFGAIFVTFLSSVLCRPSSNALTISRTGSR